MELDAKRIIEAALFMSPNPISLENLGKMAGIAAVGFVKEQIDELRKEYEERNSSLTILEENGSFIMRIKPEYVKAVSSLSGEAEISRGALRVLALVSKKEPIKQSYTVKLLGTTVYQYVPELVESGFLDAKKEGVTKILTTTQKFKNYFSIVPKENEG